MGNFSNIKTDIKEKIFKRGYGFQNYPKSLLNIKKINKKIENISTEKKIRFKKICSDVKLNIELSSLSVNKNSYNIWSNLDKLNDIEDKVSAHRWIWIYRLLDEEKINKKKKFKFISESLNNWFYLFSNTTIDKRNPIFESYTISERLVLYVFLVEMKIIKPNKDQIHYLNKQFIYLTENIEFYYQKDSNHILNNVRAIMIYAKFIQSTNHLNFFIKTLNNICTRFIDRKGFFKFCSSHYQFIFTKWIIDIYLYSYRSRSLKKKVNLSISACKFFEVESKKKIIIPLFGNISPDFSPDYISNFINNISYYRKDINKNKIYTRLYRSKFLKSFRNFKYIDIYKNKEWKKIFNKNFTIYTRDPNLNGFEFNHGHNDYFNFVVFIKKKPFIIDIGRDNYSDNSKRYLLAKYHNSFFIGKKNPFDKFLKNSFIPNFSNNNSKNYKVKVNKLQNKILIKYFDQKIKFARSLQILNENNFHIKNKIKNKSSDQILMLYYFATNIRITKKKKNLILSLGNFNVKLNFISNINYTLNKKNYYFSKIHNQKYGDKINLNFIKIKFNRDEEINFDLNLKVKN